MSVVLGPGALVAIDRRDRRMGAILRLLQGDAVPVRTSAAAVAQAWRCGQHHANLARVLPGLDVAALDGAVAKRVGELLRACRTNDLVHAHLALLAEPGGSIFTADGVEMTALLKTSGVKATVICV